MISRHHVRRFLAPTTGLRRAMVAIALGLVLFIFGSAISFRLVLLPMLSRISDGWIGFIGQHVAEESIDQWTHFLGGAFLFLGAYLMFNGARGLLRRLVEILNPGMKAPMVNTFVRRQLLSQGPRIVALGGGTGLSTLLRGLKQHSSNITAIVTVTDDGGSSGRLVSEMGIIPPGDLRNCLVALADAEKMMTDLFQHRFKNASGSLSGHSLGNLLIAGLVEQCDGDFERALSLASEVLAIRGRVLPSTLSHIRLRALMEDGEEICGETHIVGSGKRIRRIYIEPENAQPFQEALNAIRDAELICIGPGSVYTSVIPNLLVSGIAQALRDSQAIKAYICNVMTQPGESDSFTAAEHLVAIQANVDNRIVDYVFVNNGLPSDLAQDRYRESDQFVVEPDIDRIKSMGFKVVSGNFMSEQDYVRHDPFKVAARLMTLINR